MPTFRFTHTVEIVVAYEAATIEDARTQAVMDARDQTVGDLVHAAADLFILDPKACEDNA